MITVNLKGVQTSMNAVLVRMNARAGQATNFQDGIFDIAVDMFALGFSVAELALSTAVDVRRIADTLEGRKANYPGEGGGTDG